ncbi:MAG: hypothetical protein WAK91_00590, partial [Candidatus Acidiferrales bacterium]
TLTERLHAQRIRQALLRGHPLHGGFAAVSGGAFADGSGWEAVATILVKDGYMVSVAQPPETSYADDQKYTKAAINAMGG